MPREGTETILQCVLLTLQYSHNLEIRCPERGRKRVITYQKRITPCLFGNKMPREGTETIALVTIRFLAILFGNKMPREGTETDWAFQPKEFRYLEIRYPERGRKRGLRRLLITVFNVG